MGHYRVLNRIPCVIEQILISIHLIYSRVFMSILVSQFMSPSFPLGNHKFFLSTSKTLFSFLQITEIADISVIIGFLLDYFWYQLMHYVLSGNCSAFLLHWIMENRNNVTVFILLGLSQNKNIEIFCFVLFLFCYTAIWMGNLLIMISIVCSPLIDQPMYFFLNYLSLFDLCYTSTVTPKLMADLLAERKTISYSNCMTQLFSLHFFGAIEIFILTGMAMTATWPSASPCTTPSSWADQSVTQSSQLAALGGFYTLPVSFSSPSSYPFVAPVRLITTSVMCILCWNWLAWIHTGLVSW